MPSQPKWWQSSTAMKKINSTTLPSRKRRGTTKRSSRKRPSAPVPPRSMPVVPMFHSFRALHCIAKNINKKMATVLCFACANYISDRRRGMIGHSRPVTCRPGPYATGLEWPIMPLPSVWIVYITGRTQWAWAGYPFPEVNLPEKVLHCHSFSEIRFKL